MNIPFIHRNPGHMRRCGQSYGNYTNGWWQWHRALWCLQSRAFAGAPFWFVPGKRGGWIQGPNYLVKANEKLDAWEAD